jgi:tRNA(His) guanylyltransferase
MLQAVIFNGLQATGKNKLLFQQGVIYNDLPNWQKRDMDINFEELEREGWNPRSEALVITQRRRLRLDIDPPVKNEYGRLIKSLPVIHSRVEPDSYRNNDKNGLSEQ